MTQLPRYALGVLMGVLLWMLVSSHGNAAEDTWRTDALAAHHVTLAWLARGDSLSRSARARDAVIIQLTSRMTQAEANFDSLRFHWQAHMEALGMDGRDSMAAHVFAACDAALQLCKARGDSLAKQDSLDRAAAMTFRARVLVADSLLTQGVKATSCHFALVFGCLTRVQSFALGGVLGIVGTAILLR